MIIRKVYTPNLRKKASMKGWFLRVFFCHEPGFSLKPFLTLSLSPYQIGFRFVRSYNSLFCRKLVFGCVGVASQSGRNQVYSTKSNTTYGCCIEAKCNFVCFGLGFWFPIYSHTFIIFNNNFIVITSTLTQ